METVPITSRIRVLLVEDNPNDAAVVAALLRTAPDHFSYEVRGSLGEACHRLEDGEIDVILLDFDLPDSTGMDTFAAIEKCARDIAIVALTGTGDNRVAIEAVRRGAQDYLFKGSVTASLLLRAIRYAHERKQDEVELRRARDELEQRVEERTSELRALSHRLVEAQEEERHAIARELHDEIGQLLTGLKLVLETSVRQSDEKRNESFERAQALVNEVMGRVRDMSLNLRPVVLDDLGLLHALLWHIERYTAQSGIHVDFSHQGLDGRRFGSEIETSVFRIVQEALTNIARYAGVASAAVSVSATETELTVKIEDHGAGFDPAAALAKHRTSGLGGMRERATLLGGRFSMQSAPGSGATIMATVPLAAKQG